MGNDIAVNVDRAGLPEPFGPVRGQGGAVDDRRDNLIMISNQSET